MIKVTLDSKQGSLSTFPKLMLGQDGLIVFFLKTECGTVIVSSKRYDEPVAGYSTNWVMSYFTDYNNPLTIQNMTKEDKSCLD